MDAVADTIATVELATARGRFVALTTGRGPTVVVLHGFPDSPLTFRPLLVALASRGYRAVAPWMRGYAPSTLAGPYDIETVADDLAAWLEVLTPATPARVIGHDWGAIATYAASVRHPDRIAAAVTLSVPHPIALLRALRGGQFARSWYMLFFQLPGAYRVARARDFALIDRLWRRWSPSYRLPDVERESLHECLAASWPAPAAYYRALTRPVRAALARVVPGSPARERVGVPTLYLHGEEDGCIAAEVGRDAGRAFAGPYRRDVVPGGHFLAAEHPTRVADRASAWFAEHGV
jgi:pimeloyl-ACP methyl ester carboxylesterase